MKKFLLLFLCQCSLPGGDVLSIPAGRQRFTDCTQAVQKGKESDFCSGFVSCSATDTRACTTKAICFNGRLALSVSCVEKSSCKEDSQCEPFSWCIDGLCETCNEPVECPTCPSGMEHIIRNACRTCDCGPVSKCESCLSTESCQAGLYCLNGCVGDSCCIRQCTDDGCGKNPEGCAMDCGSLSCETECFGEKCDCTPEGYRCTPRCSPDSGVYTQRCRVP